MTASELLAMHLTEETEGERSPIKHIVDPRLEQTIDINALALERLLDGKWLAQLQTMTAEQFGRLSATEQRTWTLRAIRFEKRFAEIANMCRRNCAAPPQRSAYPLDFARAAP